MSLFRTSRILQLLLAAALVAGPLLPLVQIFCGMEHSMSESDSMAKPVVREGIRNVADMPCPAHKAAVASSDVMKAGADDAANLLPEISLYDCTTSEGDAYRTCCQSAESAVAAALPVRYPERMLAISAAVIQPPGSTDAPPALHAQPGAASFAAPIPSPENHQALLATFLI